MTSPTTPADGRVLQVSVSPGGVPKLPVERAWVGPWGLDGDAHHDDTVHGGPHRAVALFAIEAIQRVAAEGHPIFPGSAGENLTTEGIEWAELPVGTRVAVGDDGLLLEISKPDNPCETIRGSFSDERFARISILTHPTDSRMYARVLVEGEVRPGDPIRLMPPADGTEATLHELLDRVEAAGRSFNVALWQAVTAAGYDVRVLDDGELTMVASPELPGRAFNRASGFRQLPNLLPRMLDWFRTNGTAGWIFAEVPPWPGAVAEHPSSIHIGEPAQIETATRRIGAATPPSGVTVREIDAADAGTFAALLVEASSIPADEAPAWLRALPRLVGTAGHHYYLAESDGVPCAVANTVIRRKVGVLGMMAVLPAVRGRGIQRALIAHRATHAAELGATLIAAGANEGSVSAANLAAGGLRPVWREAMYRFDPATPPEDLA